MSRPVSDCLTVRETGPAADELANLFLRCLQEMVLWVDLCQLSAHINTSGRECTDLPSAGGKSLI